MEDKKESCKTCKKGFNNKQWGMIVLSFYMLGSTIYTTVELVKIALSYF